MNTKAHDITVYAETPLRQALEVLDRAGSGFLMAVDSDQKLVGVMTDGDIRRALLRGMSLDSLVEDAMRRDFVCLSVNAEDEQIRRTLDGPISFVPLVDAEGKLVDFASIHRYRRFPVMEPAFAGNEEQYLMNCIRSGWISSQGRYVTEFEAMLAEYHGVPFALAVSNGTVALHLALVSLGIGPGDEVIVPDFTFAATASAVIHAGATPVFVDVDEQIWTMDPAEVERAVTSRTRCIIPVHIYGQPCNMNALMDLARDKGLRLIEDCAESLGAKFNEKVTGGFGDAACFSFFGNKIITTGEGGAVLFREQEHYERAKMLRDHGMDKNRRYWHLEAGFNYRMTNMQAAVGVAQMERIEEILARRADIAAQYTQALTMLNGVRLASRSESSEAVCWLFTFAVSSNFGMTRDQFAERLLRNGVDTRPAFQPLHLMPAFARFAKAQSRDAFPVTEGLARDGVSLPSSINLSDDDIDTIVKTVRGVLGVRHMMVGNG